MKMLTGNMSATRVERGDDFYASPYAALPPLLVAERRRLPRTLWEPSCGNGALVVPLRNRGFDVVATDLNDWGCPDSTSDVDFLENVAGQFAPKGQFGIVTNPPFNIVESYVERAVERAPYVALLLRLAFLESEGRMRWFPTVGLRRVHIIGERLPMMHRHGYEGPKLTSAAMAFAWYIFEHGPRRSHQVPVRWVSWKDSCRRHPQTERDLPPVARLRGGLFEGMERPPKKLVRQRRAEAAE
jgi:hypothetical protein